MEDEIWKVADAPFEKYEVSSLGRIRGRRTGTIIQPSKKELEETGRNFVCLWKSAGLDGTRCTQSVSRVVAKAFVPGDWTLTPEHVDENLANDRASNLRWVPADKNRESALASGKIFSRQVLKLDPVTRNPLERYPSCAAACRALGKPADSSTAISKAIRKGWRYADFYWAYAP